VTAGLTGCRICYLSTGFCDLTVISNDLFGSLVPKSHSIRSFRSFH
jgi:hypothetical protein